MQGVMQPPKLHYIREFPRVWLLFSGKCGEDSIMPLILAKMQIRWLAGAFEKLSDCLKWKAVNKGCG